VLYATRGEDFDSSSCFGEYEMSQKLGEGGFGNVYLAKHRQSGDKFAIKIIKTENIGSVSDIDNIFVEAEILKSLNHENIVKVHNCFTLKNMEVAIIMEFLQGGELLKYVEKEGRLDEKTAQVFFRQIVKGMKYCHQHNLIHRDLKLENVLLVNSEEKKIKIIDFGIAGAITFFTQEDLDTGSLSYMAPECFHNQKDYKVDGRIDVWATGVILYCMLHG
jgi:serine/threonine protein kinase